MSLRSSFLFCTLACLIAIGCNRGPTVYEVTGKVTFDGEPVEFGEVVFESAAGDGQDAGPIIKGKFKAKVKPGKHIVRIIGTKLFDLPAGEKTPWGSTKESKQYLPEKYNLESKTTVEIAGPLTRDFELTSK